MSGRVSGIQSGWQWAGTQTPLTILTCQVGGPAPGPGCTVAPAACGHEEPSGMAEPQPRCAAHPLLVLGHGMASQGRSPGGDRRWLPAGPGHPCLALCATHSSER